MAKLERWEPPFVGWEEGNGTLLDAGLCGLGGRITSIRSRALFMVQCRTKEQARGALGSELNGDNYLVDPASSHMLVSKIKPCMSKYTPLHGETANGSLNQLWFLRSYNPTWITVVILELIHETKLRPSGKSAFIRSKPIGWQHPSTW